MRLVNAPFEKQIFIRGGPTNLMPATPSFLLPFSGIRS
jgi:hypothetical protein